MIDDTLRLRSQSERQEQLQAVLTGMGCRVFVGKVTTATASIAVGEFLVAQPQRITGAESEGSTATVEDADADELPVLLLGPGTPSQDDLIIARQVNSRWVTDWDGTGGTSIECLCYESGSVPTTLNWTSELWCRDSTTCTDTMLDSTSGTLTYANPITWGATPCDLSDYVSTLASGWVGEFTFYQAGVGGFLVNCSAITPSFVDQCTEIDGGSTICYWLGLACDGTLYLLSDADVGGLCQAVPYAGSAASYSTCSEGYTCNPFSYESTCYFNNSSLTCGLLYTKLTITS